MMKNLILSTIAFLFFLNMAVGQDIVINEVMSKNTNTLQDKDGDYSDWIELYNKSSSAINLNNYHLSDDNANSNKWTFPNITLQPNNYLLIFASNKNILDTNEMHTNFKLSSIGEKIYLSNSASIIVDQTDSVSLSNNQSYGRIPDGNVVWIKMDQASPSFTNNNANQLDFSHQEGFYTAPFHLSINSLSTDTIYYTLNGDIPTSSSSLYSTSILINNKNTSPNIVCEIPTTPPQDLISYKAWQSPSHNIDKATIFRAASFKNGAMTSHIYTKSFFIDNNIFNKYSLPVISLISDSNSFFNADTGIYVSGINYDSNDPDWSGNYFMHGENWERDVHIEYYKNDGTLEFSQDAGIKIHGGLTRHAAQKSIKLYARNEYGKKYFNAKLLPQKELIKYKRFLLRTTMGGWWNGQSIIQDAFAQNVSRSLNIDVQDFQPVIVYINGEYWGVQTIRDRIDERHISSLHNISKDSVVLTNIKHHDYQSLMQFIELNSLKFNYNYEFVKTKIDIINYIDYTIAEQFFANRDWPGNNMKIWKEFPHGKWKWLLYDLDAGFSGKDYNMFEHATKESEPPTFLFRNLLKNEAFKKQFTNRFAEILNKEFNVKKMTETLNTIKAMYQPEIIDHIKRWNYPNSYNQWENDVDNNLLFFIEERSCVIENQIKVYFNLTEFDYSCLDIKNDDNIILAPNPNDGNFYIYNNLSDLNNSTIRINSISGVKVYEEKNVTLIKNRKKYFYFSNLATGTYIFHIISANFSTQLKLVIME